MVYDYPTLRKAFADNDADLDNGTSFTDLLAELGSSADAVMEVAQQRAMRVAFVATGRQADLDMIQAQAPVPSPVRLDEEQRRIMRMTAPAYMDGVAAGLRLAREARDG